MFSCEKQNKKERINRYLCCGHSWEISEEQVSDRSIKIDIQINIAATLHLQHHSLPLCLQLYSSKDLNLVFHISIQCLIFRIQSIAIFFPKDPVTKNFLQNSLDPVFGFPGIVRFSWSTAEKIMKEKCFSITW